MKKKSLEGLFVSVYEKVNSEKHHQINHGSADDESINLHAFREKFIIPDSKKYGHNREKQDGFGTTFKYYHKERRPANKQNLRRNVLTSMNVIDTSKYHDRREGGSQE